MGFWQGIDITGPGAAGAALNFICIILSCIAVASTKWAIAEPDAISFERVELGLFEYCTRRCRDYVDNEFRPTGQHDLNLVTRTEASASFLIIGILVTFFALVFLLFALGRQGFNNAVWYSSMFSFLAAFCGMVTMSIWLQLIKDLPTRFDPGPGLHLCVSSWVLSLVAGILLLINSRSITYRSPEDAVTRGGAGMI